MSKLTVLPAADRTARPWKDGGGSTIEIACFPPDAGLDNFGWRISVAAVTQAGPFSDFGAVDRILAVIEGELELIFSTDGKPRTLDPDCPPLSFPGNIGVTGSPVGTQVLDLNLMTRRGRWRGRIEHVVAPRAIILQSAIVIALFIDEGRLRWRSSTVALQPFDAVQINGDEGAAVELDGIGRVYVMHLNLVES